MTDVPEGPMRVIVEAADGLGLVRRLSRVAEHEVRIVVSHEEEQVARTFAGFAMTTGASRCSVWRTTPRGVWRAEVWASMDGAAT